MADSGEEHPSSLSRLVTDGLGDEGFLRRLRDVARRITQRGYPENEPETNDQGFPEWIHECEGKLRTDVHNPRNWFSYGVALAVVDRRTEAEHALKRAVQLAPRHTKAWHFLGMVRVHLGDYSGALEAHGKAVELAPDWAEAWCDKGVALGKLGRLDESLEAFEQAISLDDRDAFTWMNKGVSLRDLGLDSEALTAFSTAVELDSRQAGAWNGKGDMLRILGKLDAALDCFRKAVELDPLYGGAWHNLGLILFLQEEYGQCLKALNEATALPCSDPSTHLLQIAALEKLSRFEEAIAICDLALEKWADCELYKVKALLLGQMKRYDECVRVIEDASRCGYDDDVLIMTRGVALAETGRFAEGLDELDRGVKMWPNNPVLAESRAYCFYKMKSFDQSIKEIQRAIELDPNSGRPHYILALLYAAQGKSLDMLSSLRTAIGIEPDLAAEALDEEDFKPYRAMPEFTNLLAE